MPSNEVYETTLGIGPSSIDAYSRLSYTMWFALAEFIDNSTQSRVNYSKVIDKVLRDEGQPLIVTITHDRLDRTLTVDDNSIGMSRDDLINALHIARPTQDSVGRSKYGMGLKTAACWIGCKWQIVTCEYGSGEEWTATIDVEGIAHRGATIPINRKVVDKASHYTRIIVSGLHRNIQKRTEETIRWYLGSMYRFDIESGVLKIVYNDEEVTAPDAYDFDTDPDGVVLKRDLPAKTINGKSVKGWVGVLRKGGRRFGGFSLFQEKRQIQGFPNAWKPRSIFGGVDEEGGNNLVSQRLMGLIELDGFKVSHTKDAILFEGDEEEELEKFLVEQTKDLKDYAVKRRGPAAQPWTREKIRDLVDSMKKEFTSSEMQETVTSSILPPISTIIHNNEEQLANLRDQDKLSEIDVLSDLRVTVWLQENSQWDPHVTIVAGAELGSMHVIVNALHPYYCSLESSDAIDECLRQYVYDAISEFRVSRLIGQVVPDSVRRFKNDLLRVQAVPRESAKNNNSDGLSNVA